MRPEVRELFAAPNFAHVATLMPDGSPSSVSVWIDVLEDDRLLFFTGEDSQKARNLERDPRLAISVVDFTAPYRTARVRGRLVERVRGEEGMKLVDRLAQKYTGRDFPMRDRTAFLVEVEKEGYMELPFEHTPPSGG